MKNRSHLLLLIILLGWSACQGQFVEWSRVLEKHDITDASDVTDPTRIQSIQLASGDVLIIQNKHISLEREFMPFGYQYDSVSLYCLKADGSLAWQRTYPFTGRGKIYGASPLADSGFLLCGIQGIYTTIFTFNQDGFPVGLKQWPKPLAKFYPTAIMSDAENNIYLLTAEFYFKKAVVWAESIVNIFDVYYNLIKIDPSGNISWIKNTGKDVRANYLHSISYYPYTIDTSDITHISLSQFLDAGPAGTISLVNSRIINFDKNQREIILMKLNSDGNVLLNKTMIDSFTVFEYWPDKIPVTIQGATYEFRNTMSRTRDGYLFTYGFVDYFFQAPDDYVLDLYYQSFDYNGNKTDSLLGGYPPDELNKITGPGAHLDAPTLQTENGDYYSLNFARTGYEDQEEGRLTLCRFGPDFKPLSQTINPESSIYTSGFYQYFKAIYPTKDNGFLGLYLRFYGDNRYYESSGTGIQAVKFGSNANAIHYQAYIDRNYNGIPDAADTTNINGMIQREHQQQTTHFIPDYRGVVSSYCDTGTFVSSLVSYDQRLKYFTISPAEDTTRFTSKGNSDTVTFRLLPRPDIQDLQVSLTPVNNARPGFVSNYTLLAANYGTMITRNIRIRFIPDGRQEFETATLDGYTLNGDTLIWSVDSLAPFETLSIGLSCLNDIPPGLDAGDTLSVIAMISPVAADSFAADNHYLLKQAVVNSADPNDKLEAHGAGITTAQLATRDFLYYTIRFQNTGTDWAYTVVVKDTLSNLLDWSTFEMLGASHTYKLDVTDKRHLTWTFNQIYLPDSTMDEPGSHGYITFRIRPKANVTVSDVIPNRASIIFDFNAPIVTNTVSTMIFEERLTSVAEQSRLKARLYPVPASDQLILEFSAGQNGIMELCLHDILGQALIRKKISTGEILQQEIIPVSDLPAGTYMITLNQNGVWVYSGKVIKQ